MPATSKRRERQKPLLLSRRDEEMLQHIQYYRYVTALDITHLLFAPASLTYVRARLSELAGGADFQPNQSLYRFPLPQLSSGRTEKVYTLGARGRDYLIREAGIPVPWHFQPHKVRHLSQGFVTHHLTLTRFLIAARYFIKRNPAFTIERMLTTYELERERMKETHTVIPDAWILFEELQQGKHKRWLPVLFEIDRGTEYKQRFTQHIRSRVEYISDRRYETMFGQEAVTVAYATTGQLPEYQEARRKSMCQWTMETLTEMDLQEWSLIFRLTSVNRNTLYTTPLFADPVWFRPDQPTPITLFPG